MFKRILVATDGSPAKKAVAKRHRAGLRRTAPSWSP